METNELEREIKRREEQLNRCHCGLALLNSLPLDEETRVKKRLIEQEAFFIHDQLDKYYSIYAILRDEQGLNEEVLQTL